MVLQLLNWLMKKTEVIHLKDRIEWFYELPYIAALCNGVCPCESFKFAFALFEMSNFTMFAVSLKWIKFQH